MGRQPVLLLTTTGRRTRVATPEVQVQRGGETFPLRARKAAGQERERLWSRLTAANRWLAGAEERARRRLPVIVLERLITA